MVPGVLRQKFPDLEVGAAVRVEMETPLARGQHPPPPASPLGAARQPEIDLQGGPLQGMGAAASGRARRVVII